ncbi:hypothetical protein HPB47_008677 [Ixodes persulcatus]|uniref:Uncharacterized protein n=1 Tax=Ixodes persulcatus TaxID=34615 RepID=A0AC60P4F6_IXOPE|nr:hypothetical protein HPB47_008677 [Ixodes persulcatus]
MPRPSATGLVPRRFSPEESQTKTGGDAQTEERRDRGRPAAAEPRGCMRPPRALSVNCGAIPRRRSALGQATTRSIAPSAFAPAYFNLQV